MMNRKSLIRGSVLAGSIALAGFAQAASDGALGVQSIGTTDVTVTIEDLVQITGMDDIPLGNYAGVGGLTGADEFCVFRKGAGSYDVQIDSANPGASNEFQLSDGANLIPYSVVFDDDTNVGTVGTSVASGGIVTNQVGSGALDCSGADNGRLDVDFAATDLQAAPAGTYTDTITLTVSPI